MAKQNPFHRIRLVYGRSSLLMKVLVLVTILVSAAALLALRTKIVAYQQQSRALQTQAAQLQVENEDLNQRIAEIGTKDGIRRIAIEELDLADPYTQFFSPGE